MVAIGHGEPDGLGTDGVDRVAPGTHGGDGVAVARALGRDPADLLDLSASLHPFAPDVAAVAARHLSALRTYPDDTAATAALADAIGVDGDRLVLTNGGAEAISLVATHLRRGSVVDPEFSLYRRHLAEVDPSAGRWRSNPSNPLGELAAPEEEAAVWDEAFYPLATGAWTRGDDDAWRLGSLTKLWACPGLRLGYVITPSRGEAEVMRRARPRWSVNGLALAVVPEMVAHTDLSALQRQLAEARRSLVDGLAALGLDVRPSAANWVLIDGAPGLRDGLMAHGVLVRDCANFGLPGTMRMAVPHPAQLGRVLTAVERA
ncbi:MAG: aminotransferase class I/II-fold pyridoxal phosphate-dependent enzyme [Actinomycetota bacterium]